jgi:hypothetical protein
MLVMGLFDDPKSAQEALRALEAEGFSREDIDVRTGNQLTGARGSEQTAGARKSDEDNEGVLARIRHYLSDIGLSKSDSSKKASSERRAAASRAGAEPGERELSDNDVLVLVDATDDMAEQAADILGEYGVSDLAADGEGCVRVYSVIVEGDVTQPDETMESGTEAERPSGATGRIGAQDTARLSAADEREFQNDWQAKHTGASELSANEALPGYQYGYRLGQSPQYSDRDWSAVEPQAQHDWDERRFGPWERLKEAVKSGWERAHRH